jgi:hypothetical protein
MTFESSNSCAMKVSSPTMLGCLKHFDACAARHSVARVVAGGLSLGGALTRQNQII